MLHMDLDVMRPNRSDVGPEWFRTSTRTYSNTGRLVWLLLGAVLSDKLDEISHCDYCVMMLV